MKQVYGNEAILRVNLCHGVSILIFVILNLGPVFL